jgi:hypothetical protein
MNCANGELTGLRGRCEYCARLYPIPSGARGVGRDVIVASSIVCLCVFFIDKIDNKLLMIPIDFSLHFFFKN